MTDVALIYAPFMAGDAAHPVAEAPRHYVRGGVEKLLAGKGVMPVRQRTEARPPARHGFPAGLDQLAPRADEVYLHIDNDAFDPETAPGVVDEPAPGGLSLAQMEDLIHAVTSRLPVAAATIATYTPARDQQDRTLTADLRIIELLAGHAARR